MTKRDAVRTSQDRQPAKTPRRTVDEEDRSPGYKSRSGLKAGIAGGVGLAAVLLARFIPLPSLLAGCMLTLGLVVVWVGTGMLAGLLGEDEIETRRQATTNGATAGFVAGIGGGIAAMLLAALGTLFPELGKGVLAQFSPEQLEALAEIGMGADVVQRAGSILATLISCGVAGIIPSVALSALGGRLYFRLRQ